MFNKNIKQISRDIENDNTESTLNSYIDSNGHVLNAFSFNLFIKSNLNSKVTSFIDKLK